MPRRPLWSRGSATIIAAPVVALYSPTVPLGRGVSEATPTPGLKSRFHGENGLDISGWFETPDWTPAGTAAGNGVPPGTGTGATSA